MEVAYTFQYVSHAGAIVKVIFLSNNPQSGPDHSCAHQIRRNWADSLPLNQNWTKLYDHQYIQFLNNNDIHYTVYKNSVFENTKTILVK